MLFHPPIWQCLKHHNKDGPSFLKDEHTVLGNKYISSVHFSVNPTAIRCEPHSGADAKSAWKDLKQFAGNSPQGSPFSLVTSDFQLHPEIHEGWWICFLPSLNSTRDQLSITPIKTITRLMKTVLLVKPINYIQLFFQCLEVILDTLVLPSFLTNRSHHSKRNIIIDSKVPFWSFE